ncbi:hypothetical protein CMV_027187 [Castanea mollissima]|uniref:Uncharacterized protein n=1 Tax=Castanea mollissima TaxID=60419 RepID=A0A8J4VDH1_9ROSI|nr:hypothetical protein CMV_027187 [Castanea mollissima]
MVQEIPEDVDTDDALHKIDLRGKIEVDLRVRHFSHIQVWNTRAQKLCHGARLEGAMSSVHPYFGWYGKVTWRFVDHTSAALLITVAMHKQMLMHYVVDSPEHKLITAMLKEVDRLHRLAAHLPLEDADTVNPELPEHNGRPSTSSTPSSHSHGQCAAPHQQQNQPPPLPHASPAPEFPPPLHASPSPEIPPRTTPAFPDLQIPVPTTHASSHPEIPLLTLCTQNVSKRISGFDMAPPASALLSGAAAVTVWKVRIKLHGVIWQCWATCPTVLTMGVSRLL